jgi:thioredoxin reductase
MHDPDVLIVGAGPAGLAAARRLRDRGVADVLVLEREGQAGGIPRFCPHATFGVTDFFRPMSGPRYAARLCAEADGARIVVGATVTAISRDLCITVSAEGGLSTLRPKKVLLATGIRESPRAARLISGDRPQNVVTTGALQRLVEARAPLPFRAPVIVGTELVSFSAVLTLRDAGVRPVAMIESGERIVARRPADLLTRLVLRTPVLTGCRLMRINATAGNASRLESVTIEDRTGSRLLPCDAVIFTGGFVPEASLLDGRRELCDRATGGPAIDQCFRLADPRLYAAGNVLRAVETAAWSRLEGMAAADALADDLFARSPQPDRRVPLLYGEPVRSVTPAAIAVPGPPPGALHMMVRMASRATGRLTMAVDGKVFWGSRRATFHPERRIALSRSLPDLRDAKAVTIGFEA